MNKKLFALIILCFSLTLFTSCGSDDDENVVDEEWKAYNEKQEIDLAATGSGYKAEESNSGNGKIYWKTIDFFAETTKSSLSTKITEDDTPYITDSIALRYEGYYLNTDGSEHIFDTTERENNGRLYRGRVSNFVDGFSTMLQKMRKGDQVEVCIPYMLGYGAAHQYGGSNRSVVTIPGYTMIRFRMYLVDIIPDNPGEFD